MRLFYSLLVLTAACGIAGASCYARAFEFAQGVIVDSLHSVVYMMNSEGRIDAVNLSTGEVIATSARGAKPLFLYDDVLLAGATDRIDALSVVALTTKDLKPKFELELTLPSRVRTDSFYVGARLYGNEIIVQWRSIRRLISAIPTREPADVAFGFARIDPATGRLIAAEEGEPPAPPMPQLDIPATVQKLADDRKLASPLCPVDNFVSALQYVEQNGKKQMVMVLRRWNRDTGENVPSESLFGDELTFRSFSRDCRHLLASSEMDGWVWHIYSIITGKQIAEIHNPLPGPEFFVSGSNLIYQSPAAGESIAGRLRIDPPKLVALDLNSGKELWARPIGETAYAGPYPGHPAKP
jgi:outer membrane protein assembly factor BamB